MRHLTTALAAGIFAYGFHGGAWSDPPSPQDADPHTQNTHEMGHDLKEATFSVPDGQREISSDIAFQGKYAYQGNYNGFRVIDISAPGNPKLVAETNEAGEIVDVTLTYPEDFTQQMLGYGQDYGFLPRVN